MEEQALRDPSGLPEHELPEALGRSYATYTELMNQMAAQPLQLLPVWKYYKDSKAWLCNVSYRKKTVCWLSAWKGFFKISFYFTEKTASGLNGLCIDEKILQDFHLQKPIGKLIPMVISVKQKKQVHDILTVVKYKMSLL
jgi:hypothetical protein